MIVLDIILIVFISALICLPNPSIFLLKKTNFPEQSGVLASYTAQTILFPEKNFDNLKNAETKYMSYFPKHCTKFPLLFIKGCRSLSETLILKSYRGLTVFVPVKNSSLQMLKI